MRLEALYKCYMPYAFATQSIGEVFFRTRFFYLEFSDREGV